MIVLSTKIVLAPIETTVVPAATLVPETISPSRIPPVAIPVIEASNASLKNPEVVATPTVVDTVDVVGVWNAYVPPSV